MNTRKLILYISCSLDSYIAKPEDDLSFLDKVQVEGEDYGYFEFISSVDAVIVGRKTYEWVIGQGYEYPHREKETFIITRDAKPKEGNITFYNGDVTSLVNGLKARPGKNIFCDGGSAVANMLFKKNLIDEIILSVIPVILGGGTPLFETGIPERELELVSSESFKTGLVQLHYQLK
jgi:dihydrofolate reductase